jgi:uncharacterized protein with GYD domain
MPTYLTLFDYTDAAWRHMVASPGDREAAARQVIEASGGTLVAFYWMLGDHDGLAIFEVDDAAMATGVLAGIASAGMVKGTYTSTLLNATEALHALEHAQSVTASYAPPGGAAAWRAEYDQRR